MRARIIDAPSRGASPDGGSTAMKTFQQLWELAKPRIVCMVLVTAALGYVVGSKDAIRIVPMLLMLAGTGLAAAGSAILNNYLERDIDARMARTRNRVLPSGAFDPALALGAGVLLVLGGVILLASLVHLLAAFLVLLTAFLYVLVYTPLKRHTWLNTPIGAIPGALPPMVGWAAAAGQLDLGAWILFGILYAWQHPHFYAIAWMYRQDYQAAGFKMLSVVDPTGRRCFHQSILFCLALIVVSMGLAWLDVAGDLYLVGAVLAGALLLTACVQLWNGRTVRDARRVLLASVVYLPVMLVLIVVDAGLRGI